MEFYVEIPCFGCCVYVHIVITTSSLKSSHLPSQVPHAFLKPSSASFWVPTGLGLRATSLLLASRRRSSSWSQLGSPSSSSAPFPLSLSYPCSPRFQSSFLGASWCKLPQFKSSPSRCRPFPWRRWRPPPWSVLCLLVLVHIACLCSFLLYVISWLNAGNAVRWSPLACSLNLLVFSWWWCTLIRLSYPYPCYSAVREGEDMW